MLFCAGFQPIFFLAFTVFTLMFVCQETGVCVLPSVIVSV